MTDWYYVKNGRQCGPVDTDALNHLAETGQLQPADLIWREGLPKWGPASAVNGLFDLSRRSPQGTKPEGGVPMATAGQSGVGMAVAALILGISAILTPPLGIITGIIAIVLGSASLRKPKGKGMAVGGIITGGIGLVISLIVALVSLLVPVMTAAIGESERMVCVSNLKVIGKAYQDYAHLHPDSIFPRHVDYPTVVANSNGVGGIVAAGSDTLDATIGVNSMNTVWVFISRGMLTDGAFHCPGDEAWESRTAMSLYGWGALTEFSYGVHWPYASDDAIPTTINPADPKAQYDDDVQGAGENPVGMKGDWKYMPNWIIMADRNPGGAVDGRSSGIEHSNHKGKEMGCAVVTRIGNASFYDSRGDSMAGFADNIYTDDGDGNAGGSTANTASFPELRTDTVISPTVSR